MPYAYDYDDKGVQCIFLRIGPKNAKPMHATIVRASHRRVPKGDVKSEESLVSLLSPNHIGNQWLCRGSGGKRPTGRRRTATSQTRYIRVCWARFTISLQDESASAPVGDVTRDRAMWDHTASHGGAWGHKVSYASTRGHETGTRSRRGHMGSVASHGVTCDHSEAQPPRTQPSLRGARPPRA